MQEKCGSNNAGRRLGRPGAAVAPAPAPPGCTHTQKDNERAKPTQCTNDESAQKMIERLPVNYLYLDLWVNAAKLPRSNI